MIKGGKSYSCYNLVVLLGPEVLPGDPEPYVCSTDTVLEMRPNLAL